MDITAEKAFEIIEKASKKAKEINVPMVIAVVDSAGHLKAFKRMDDAILASIDIAANKAFTAAACKAKTEDLSELANPGGELFGINTTNNGRIVTFGGGIPLAKDGEIIGAIGVSGGSVEEDVTVAKAGVEAL
ncbi:heme-degrading [Natranaerofaba carboxydovora]|nr:heme-binding protein [Natranaerofaba carboxydovora]UMZ73459.1 heme-degrading [Natranaerofaba carboxydovora]